MSAKTVWTIIRTLSFLIVGIFNTILIRPEHIGNWRHFLGYGFLLIALFDTVYLLLRLRGKTFLVLEKQYYTLAAIGNSFMLIGVAIGYTLNEYIIATFVSCTGIWLHFIKSKKVFKSKSE